MSTFDWVNKPVDEKLKPIPVGAIVAPTTGLSEGEQAVVVETYVSAAGFQCSVVEFLNDNSIATKRVPRNFPNYMLEIIKPTKPDWEV